MKLSDDPPADSLSDAAWQERVCAGLDEAGRELVLRARDWALPHLQGEIAVSGEPVEHHAAGAARILADLQTDAEVRAAAMLGALPDTSATRDEMVVKAFGPAIGRLVQGSRALLRLTAATRESSDSAADSGAQKEMLRKMLLAMAADLRIVLMRLASRYQTLRWHAAAKQPCTRDFARETLDIYTPLANRLGIWQIKWEMEDLAFRFLDSDKYKEIAKLLEEKRTEREAFIRNAIERIRAALTAAGVDAEISGRPKHIYSIWNKMRVKRLAFSQLYDLRALRVIVEDERACYTALGVVQALWPPLTDEFDDYISRPKPNGYRSLHTVLLDDDGRPFEVQIRTREMHNHAEFGMAAHWHYKEAGKRGGQVAASSTEDRQVSWLRQLLAWNADVSAAGPEAPDAVGKGGGRIYVLTPQARVIELPEGATPVDFAYNLHTDLGHRCRGARVNGQMVPLLTRLATGQTVEIIAAKSGGPSRDWLNPQLGYLASSRSRSKVRLWFNAIELQQRITQGQALVEKELQRLGKTAVNLEQLAQQHGFAKADDLYIAVAKDEFSLRHLEAGFNGPVEREEPGMVASGKSTHAPGDKTGVLVVGVDSLLTQLARCCRPAPPDLIRGFVTRGRGVSIHRQDCTSFAALAARHPERVIEVAWGGRADDARYPVDISVRAQDRSGLLRDISEAFSKLRLNVIGVNTQSRQSLAHMIFTIEVVDGEQLGRAIHVLGEVPGILSVQRR